jgi:hypothetical protein
MSSTSSFSKDRKDQTDPAWIPTYRSYHREEYAREQNEGTGVFLFEDVSSKGGLRKSFLPNISYERSQEHGKQAIAFKWVPQSIAPLEQLRSGGCGMPCVDTCTEPGCLCVKGFCV